MSTIRWKLKSRLETFISKTNFFRNLIPSFLQSLRDKPVFFIVIGANDGIFADPLYPFVKKYRWKGVYVEPQKKMFEKLKDNLSEFSDLYFENIAITEKEETVTLYIPISDKTINSTGQASLLPEGGDLMYFSNIEQEKVAGKPISYLAEKYALNKKDNVLLIIDVEGYEKNILLSFDFNLFKPKYILFEHDHLTYNTHRNINGYLSENGYKIYEERYDTLACRVS